MIQLTEEQRQELSQPEPVVLDPLTRKTYVLVPREVYERFKALLEEDDARLMYPLLADLDPEDWEDASAYEGKP
jgi:succinate dehydrogenase flavin-adding protein (antitoxin of CptAB toxin-antitoxin module)